jgi:hypothetical protein
VRLAGIQGGIECAKLAPRLSARADGEASAEDLALLRPHMKTCLSCRARLREFRAAPKRVAALVPPVAGVAADGGLRGVLESVLGAAQQKAAVFGERDQAGGAGGDHSASPAPAPVPRASADDPARPCTATGA